MIRGVPTLESGPLEDLQVPMLLLPIDEMAILLHAVSEPDCNLGGHGDAIVLVQEGKKNRDSQWCSRFARWGSKCLHDREGVALP